MGSSEERRARRLARKHPKEPGYAADKEAEGAKTHDDQQRQIIKLVQSIALHAMEVPPGARHAFIATQVEKIRAAYDQEYGAHPDPADLQIKLQEWTKALVAILTEAGG